MAARKENTKAKEKAVTLPTGKHGWIEWHHRLHQVTGAMARTGGRIPKGEIAEWSKQLKAMAAEMAASVKR